MKMKTMQMLAAAFSCVGMVASPLTAASPVTAQAVPVDVALSLGGTLSGQVVNAQGAALAEAPVAIYQNGQEVLRVATNPSGVFRADGLRGGVYDVVAPGHQGQVRLWAPGTAPPAANQGLLMVAGHQTVLGQSCGPCGPAAPACGACGGPFGAVTGWVAQHPFLTAGVIAAAIAIPLAIDDDDDAS